MRSGVPVGLSDIYEVTCPPRGTAGHGPTSGGGALATSPYGYGVTATE